MTQSSTSDDLGDTNDAEVLEAGRLAYGLEPDASGDPVSILVEKLLQLARKRLSAAGSATNERSGTGFAVFLLSANVREDRAKHGAVRVPTLDAGNEQLAGHAWLVAPTLVSSGRLKLTATDLGGALDELEAAALGDLVAVVVDFKANLISVYHSGVAAEEDVIRLDIGMESTLPLDLPSVLTHFLERFLITPNCQTSSIKTWLDGVKYIPVNKAEKKVQELLAFYLRARFSDAFRFDLEVTLRSGRIDLVINRNVGVGRWQTEAAIELKVVRSFSSTGRATPPGALVRHLVRGYGQIREYRRELNAESGWLVIYDMRTPSARTNDILAPHRGQAAADKLNLRLEPVWGSADDYRDAQPAQA